MAEKEAVDAASGKVSPGELAYWRRLLAPVKRKIVWQLAAQAGDAAPDRAQSLLFNYRSNAGQVRNDTGGYVG